MTHSLKFSTKREEVSGEESRLCSRDDMRTKTEFLRKTGCVVAVSLLVVGMLCSGLVVPAEAKIIRGKADFGAGANAMVSLVKSQQEQAMDETKKAEIPDYMGMLVSSFLDGGGGGRWNITRTVLYGAGGLSDAAAALRSNAALIVSAVGLATAGTDELRGSNSQTIGTGNTTRAEVAVNRVMQLAGVLDSLSHFPIFNGSDAPFEKTQKAALLLLVAIFGIRVAWLAWQLLQGGGEAKAIETVTLLIKFAAMIIFITHIEDIGCWFIDAGDAVRDYLSEGGVTFGLIAKMWQAKLALTGLSTDVSLMDALLGGAGNFLASLVVTLMFWVVQTIMFVIEVLADLCMAITLCLGPLAVAVSLAPSMGQFFGEFVRALITYSLYGPLVAIYTMLMIVMVGVGVDTGAAAFVLLAFVYTLGAMKIPEMARSISGAPLGSTVESATGMIGGTAGGIAGRALSSGAGNVMSRFGG